jgi:phage terminase large subunit-like protein
LKLQDLRDLYNSSLQNPHYQYLGAHEDFLLTQALKSFIRIPNYQQEMVKKSWFSMLSEQEPSYLVAVEKCGADAVALKELLDSRFKECLLLRFLAQTNLFFLAHMSEKGKDMTLYTHEDICNDFFVRKDPTALTFKQFAKPYSDLKRRMILVPRNGFKSTIDILDCVQYAICWPEVSILIMTGTIPLATEFVGEVKKHFTLRQSNDTDAKGKPIFFPNTIMNETTGEHTVSMLQVLFPEHCTRPGEGKEKEWDTPARAAMGVVHNQNVNTTEAIAKVNHAISVNRGMLNPEGFIDVVGTWYDEHDFYGQTLKQEETQAIVHGKQHLIQGSIDSGQFNSAINVKCYLRACWWPKPSAKGKADEEMGPDDYIYWFPERLTFEFLKIEQLDPVGFAIKFLNNPRKINKIRFPRDLMVRKTLPQGQMPNQGVIVTAVDTAYSPQPWADYTVIMTAVIYGGRFYIINMKRGRWNEDDLPKMIASVAKQWFPKQIAIEESVGVKWLGKEIRREMAKLQISVPLSFVSLGKGSKKTAKIEKAKPVIRLLNDDRLYFSVGCEGLNQIYEELELFTGTTDDKHDDIVSAISLLVDQFSGYADMPNKDMQSWNQSQFVADSKSKAMHELIYGLTGVPPQMLQKSYTDAMNSVMNDDNPRTAFQVLAGMPGGGIPGDDGFGNPLGDLGVDGLDF